MPLFKRHTAYRSETSSVVHRSHEVCPPWCSFALPLARVHPKLPRPFHTEIPFRPAHVRVNEVMVRSRC
jgi:hypothetical protein